jgi:hypothetical protein
VSLIVCFFQLGQPFVPLIPCSSNFSLLLRTKILNTLSGVLKFRDDVKAFLKPQEQGYVRLLAEGESVTKLVYLSDTIVPLNKLNREM